MTQAKCARDIGAPAVRSQLDLRTCGAASDEDVGYWSAQVPRDLMRLIKASLILPSPMERNRYDAVDIVK
jgi:hypothetical protein